MSDKLQEGWVSVTLAEAVEPDAPIQYGILQPGPDIANGIPYIRPTEIRDHHIDKANLHRTMPDIAARYRRSSLKAGDVILSIVGSIGKVAIVPRSLEGANITQSSARLRPRGGFVSSGILAWFLRSPLAKKQFDEAELGTGVPRLNIGDIRSFLMPVPPAAEQRRIVARVEALLTDVDLSREHLARVATILRRFRRAILAAAHAGRLTEGWRGQHQRTGSGATLLESVRQNQLGRQTPIRGMRVEDSTGVQPEVDLPDTWAWSPVAQLCQPERALTYGVIKLGAAVVGGVPTLRSSDVRPLHIDRSDIKRIAPGIAEQYERTRLQGGEVLVTVRGTLGGVAVVPDDMRGCNVSREVAVLPLESRLNARYVMLAIGSPTSQSWLAEHSRGVAYTGVNIEDLRRLPLPIPPREEQDEIVRRTDALFAFADTIGRQIAAATSRADRLTSSILAKAFRGELVPTEATLAREERRDYEVASALLERIRKSGVRPNGDSTEPGSGSQRRKGSAKASAAPHRHRTQKLSRSHPHRSV